MFNLKSMRGEGYKMKIKVEIDPQLSETELIVRTPKIDEQEINYLVAAELGP